MEMHTVNKCDESSLYKIEWGPQGGHGHMFGAEEAFTRVVTLRLNLRR